MFGFFSLSETSLIESLQTLRIAESGQGMQDPTACWAVWERTTPTTTHRETRRPGEKPVGMDTVWIQLRKLTQLHGHKHGRVETYFCPERGKAAHPLLKAVGGHIALGQPED